MLTETNSNLPQIHMNYNRHARPTKLTVETKQESRKKTKSRDCQESPRIKMQRLNSKRLFEGAHQTRGETYLKVTPSQLETRQNSQTKGKEVPSPSSVGAKLRKRVERAQEGEKIYGAWLSEVNPFQADDLSSISEQTTHYCPGERRGGEGHQFDLFLRRP